MTIGEFRQVTAQVEWEKTKGQLRASVVVLGCFYGMELGTKERVEKFKRAEIAVENFITEFEDEGFSDGN